MTARIASSRPPPISSNSAGWLGVLPLLDCMDQQCLFVRLVKPCSLTEVHSTWICTTVEALPQADDLQ
jgi:hypothetical protein